MFLSKVKPVLSGQSKIDKTKVLKTNGSLMKVKSIAECSPGAECSLGVRLAPINRFKPSSKIFY